MAWSSFDILFLVCLQCLMCGQAWNLSCGISLKRKGFRLWSAFQSLGLETLGDLSRGGAPGLHCDPTELLEVTEHCDALCTPPSWEQCASRGLLEATEKANQSMHFFMSELRHFPGLISRKLWQALAGTRCSCPQCSRFLVCRCPLVISHFDIRVIPFPLCG